MLTLGGCPQYESACLLKEMCFQKSFLLLINVRQQVGMCFYNKTQIFLSVYIKCSRFAEQDPANTQHTVLLPLQTREIAIYEGGEEGKPCFNY